MKIFNLSQLCTLDNPLNLSSHDPLISDMKVTVEATKYSNKYSSTYTKFDRKKVIWDSSKFPQYQLLAEEVVSRAISYWSDSNCIPLLSCLLSRLLVNSACSVFKSRTVCAPTRTMRKSRQIRQAEWTLRRTFKI